MKVTQEIYGFEGKPLNMENGPLSLRTALLRALGSNLQGDTDLPVEKVMSRYALAMRISSEENVTLTPEEVAELRARVAKVWALEVAGGALKLLNGA